MIDTNTFFIDEKYGERLLVSKMADQTELNDNIRVAHVLLSCFDDMYIIINEHLLTIGHKNPEYTINGKLGDRKGVESENGIKSAVVKSEAFMAPDKEAIKQLINDVIEKLRT